MRLRLALALGCAALTAPALGEDSAAPVLVASETRYFPKDDLADFTLETAVAEARESGRYAVVVFGADWCHDSRALARVLSSDGFASRFGSRFTVTFIDVGKPQTGQGRNLELLRDLGVANLRSTPAMFVLSGIGKPLNSRKDALGWRNAEKRGEGKTLAWFAAFLKAHDRR